MKNRWLGISTLVLCLLPMALCASSGEIVVGGFSSMTPGQAVTGWAPMTFDKIDAHTVYTLVTDDGRTVLQATSHASASGMIRELSVDPETYPLIQWRWKVATILEKGDVRKKSGDDYPARIYITFAEDPAKLSFFQRARLSAIKLIYGKTPPAAALSYIWGNHAETGSIHPNPYTDRVQMIVVDSGTAHLNQWRTVERDLVADFREAFGSEPPPISGIAVMTDTDNTAGSATAWYGDIILRQR